MLLCDIMGIIICNHAPSFLGNSETRGMRCMETKGKGKDDTQTQRLSAGRNIGNPRRFENKERYDYPTVEGERCM